MPQDTKTDQETDEITNEPKRLNGDHSLPKVAPVIVPVRLRLILVSTGIFLAALLIVSLFYPYLSERIKFFTVNALSICVLAAIVVQAYIYRRQWEVMERQFAAFENQTGQSEWQFRQTQRNAVDIQGQMRDQSQAMQGQLEAMQRQAGFIEAQAKIMADSLTETRKVVEHNEKALKASQEHSDRQFAVMEFQAGIAEIQTGLVDQQVNAMKGQLEAMQRQAEFIETQAKLMADSLTETRKMAEVASVQAKVAERNAIAAEDNVKGGREAFYTGQRAYMGIIALEFDDILEVGRTVSLKITWKNGGKTPAWNFRCLPEIVLSKDEPPPVIHFADDDFSDISGSFWPADREMQIPYQDCHLTITDKISEELWKGTERRIWVSIKAVYRDISGDVVWFYNQALWDVDQMAPTKGHFIETFQYVDFVEQQEKAKQQKPDEKNPNQVLTPSE